MASWYATPSVAVEHRFTAILAADWKRVIVRSWDSKSPLLVFAHVVLTKTLGVCRAKDIRARITSPMDLWKRGLHTGPVGDANAEGAASDREEEDKAVARSYHDTVLSSNLRQAVRQATNREGKGCFLQDDQCTKTGQPAAEVLREKHTGIRFPPVENPGCACFKKYG